MDDAKSPLTISRRDFLKGGAVGAATLSSALLVRSEAEARIDLPGAKTSRISLQINATKHTLDVDNRWSLLYILREKLGLTGTKQGCDGGQCGACTVLMGDRPVY